MTYSQYSIKITFIVFTVFYSCNVKQVQMVADTDCIQSSQVTATTDCSYTYTPVCGCDSKTYRNVCFAKAHGLRAWDQGICPEACIDKTIVLTDEICTRDREPVCGCNGKTYANACAARKSGVLTYVQGECGQSDARD